MSGFITVYAFNYELRNLIFCYSLSMQAFSAFSKIQFRENT